MIRLLTAAALALTLYNAPAPHLLGVGCTGTLLGVAIGAEESDMPRCHNIFSL